MIRSTSSTRGAGEDHDARAVEDDLESMVRNARSLRAWIRPGRPPLRRHGFQAAKSYDVEVWLPAGEFARSPHARNQRSGAGPRSATRASARKVDYCHTLNGSGLAVGRALIACSRTARKRTGV